MNKKKLPDLPWTQPIAVATLNGVTHLHLVPDATTCAAIARFSALHALEALDARLTLTPRSDGLIRIVGQIKARAQPVCVVSLEPFEQPISTEIEASFAPAGVIAKMAKRILDEKIEHPEDLPEEILAGQIDPAALVVEMLVLALDPYPKKPGVTFSAYEEPVEAISPFAALESLKDKQ